MREARRAYEPLITTPQERSLYAGSRMPGRRFERADREVAPPDGIRAAAGGDWFCSSDPTVVALYDGSRATAHAAGGARRAGSRLETPTPRWSGRTPHRPYGDRGNRSVHRCGPGRGGVRSDSHLAADPGDDRRRCPKLADGETGTEVPFRQRRDEIGAMAAAVQVFKENLIRTGELEAEAEEARRSAEAQRKAGMRPDGRPVRSGRWAASSDRSPRRPRELQATAQIMTAGPRAETARPVDNRRGRRRGGRQQRQHRGGGGRGARLVGRRRSAGRWTARRSSPRRPSRRRIRPVHWFRS